MCVKNVGLFGDDHPPPEGDEVGPGHPGHPVREVDQADLA